MPGLIGKINLAQFCESSQAPEISTKIEHQNYKFIGNSYEISFAKNSRSCAYYESDSVIVFYEGIIFGDFQTAEKTASYLHERYMTKGELFTRELHGSFQIFVLDSRPFHAKFYLYSDHIASRQIFFATSKRQLFFSPDIDTLVTKIPVKTTNEMSMVYFLVSGHFPSGRTAINELRVLGPGEFITIQEDSIRIKSYFNFTFKPFERIPYQEAIKKLDDILTERILEHWRYAEIPAILLSGGYDSQYIFYTIAKTVQDTSRLTTVTWGQDPKKKFADMAIARKTAKYYNTQHIEILKNNNSWNREYDEMFIAQNGMTDSSFYHAHEFSVCKTLRKTYGIKSVIRGDECLGYGPESFSAQNALQINSMSFPDHILNFANWFKSGHQVQGQYNNFMNDLINQYHYNSFDDLKDILDFYERQHMNRNPLNYFKLHCFEVFCPLIDPDVLNLISSLPAQFRNSKKLFKDLVHANFGGQLEIAQHTNLTDWRNVINESNEIKNFLKNEFSKLPSFIDPNFFGSLIDQLENQSNIKITDHVKNFLKPIFRSTLLDPIRQKAAKRRLYKSKHLQIPIQMLIIRAAVLARWNDWWISNN